jgi:hypothetical protein
VEVSIGWHCSVSLVHAGASTRDSDIIITSSLRVTKLCVVPQVCKVVGISAILQKVHSAEDSVCCQHLYESTVK